jgi:hypothetical protein
MFYTESVAAAYKARGFQLWLGIYLMLGEIVLSEYKLII